MTESFEKQVHKQLRNWVLIGVGAAIFLGVSFLNIYFKIGSNTISYVTAFIDFTVLVISIIFFIRVQKWKKAMTEWKKESEEKVCQQ
jgi:large-conductance mechanosensitive channel